MNARGRRVYLVDEDPGVLKGLARLLRSAGYEPETFSSAREFMEKYHSDVPGSLVLDLSMPEFTGLELQRWLMWGCSHWPSWHGLRNELALAGPLHP